MCRRGSFKKEGFLGILSGSLRSSLLGNLLTGKKDYKSRWRD